MNSQNIKIIKSSNADKWDQYVKKHPNSTLYHLYNWQEIIKKTYGHNACYLTATNTAGDLLGILPLFHMKHFIFGNSLISIPFFDMGGILADNKEIESALLSKAVSLGQKLKCKFIELRHTHPLCCIDQNKTAVFDDKKQYFNHTTLTHKVRMILDLPDSSKILMKSFKSKLRSQIKKPIKEGLKAKIGGIDLVDDFYQVFLINMRDLGSPVHSKNIIKNVLKIYSDQAKIVIIYNKKQPVACSVMIGFKDTMENPWSSSLHEYSRLSPNMLLYWTMLEYASDKGFKYFDFGRSTQEEGTYKFKKQWGAKPESLHWHYISINGETVNHVKSEKSKFDKAILYWQKLPVSVTKFIGPKIRKHIAL